MACKQKQHQQQVYWWQDLYSYRARRCAASHTPKSCSLMPSPVGGTRGLHCFASAAPWGWLSHFSLSLSLSLPPSLSVSPSLSFPFATEGARGSEGERCTFAYSSAVLPSTFPRDTQAHHPLYLRFSRTLIPFLENREALSHTPAHPVRRTTSWCSDERQTCFSHFLSLSSCCAVSFSTTYTQEGLVEVTRYGVVASAKSSTGRKAAVYF